MSTTRLQEVLICFGKQKQTDIATANTGAQMWQLRKLNAALANPKLNTENDAEEFGKGHEFPTQSFQTSWDVNGTLEKYLGSEIGAWAMVYGLGKVVKSGTTPNFTYMCTPLIPANGDAAELPYFSFVEQIRPGAGVVVDRMAVGCVVEGWTISIGSGPGRANSKITVEFLGSGQVTEPSGITIPAATLEKLLPSASLALTIDGVKLRLEQEHHLAGNVLEEQRPPGWVDSSLARVSRRRAMRQAEPSAAAWNSPIARAR